MSKSYTDYLDDELKRNDGDPVDLAFLVFMMPILLPMEVLGKIINSLASDDQ